MLWFVNSFAQPVGILRCFCLLNSLCSGNCTCSKSENKIKIFHYLKIVCQSMPTTEYLSLNLFCVYYETFLWSSSSWPEIVTWTIQTQNGKVMNILQSLSSWFPVKITCYHFSFFDLWPACLTCYLLGHKSKGGNLHNILLSWLVSGSIIIIEIMSWLSFCWMQGFAPPAYNPTGGYYMPPTPAQAAYPVMSNFVQ